MRTVLRCVALFSLLGMLAVTSASSAAEGRTARGKAVGFVPKHLQTASRFAGHVTQQDVVEGGTYYEDPESGQLVRSNGHISEMMGEPMMPSMGEPLHGAVCADGNCGSCGDCAYTACCLPFSKGSLQIFGGVQGFTGPANRPNGGGSFGFHEGFNWGTPLPGFQCLSGQVGIRATQSNLSGAEFTNDTRNQGFLTAGLFRRVDQGLQCGVVIDYLTEGWYRDADLTNVRGEFSWVHAGCQDLGFWFTASTNSAVEMSLDADRFETWEPTDLFAFFFRQKFGECNQGEARLSAGWSSRSDGYLAVDTLVPLTSSLSLEANFAYLIPEQGAGTGINAGHTQESWNVSMGLVWYPGHCRSGANSYARPLLRVADNGVFMMDRVQ